jgi:hypothetical protein
VCRWNGQRPIAGGDGDYNANHTDWGARFISFRGHELIKLMENNNLKHMSTGEPTYWSSDRNKLQHLVDLYVTEGIPQGFSDATSCVDISSDHSPILITLTAHAMNQETEPILSNRYTNLDEFRCLINERLT